MSHDTDLIIRQDEKSREDKRKKRKRRKKKAAKEEDGGGGGEEKEDGMPQDKKAHVEDMEQDGEETGGKKEDGKVDGEKRTGHDGDTAGSGTPAAESRSDPVRNETDAGQTLDHTPDATNAEPKACEKKAEGGTHRAGFDAFMTGYVFAFASARNADGSWIPSCANKLYLSGKSVPLHIAKSAFSKSSKAHVTKMEHVWKKQIPKADGSV